MIGGSIHRDAHDTLLATSHHLKDSVPLGATGQAVRCIFDVAGTENLPFVVSTAAPTEKWL